MEDLSMFANRFVRIPLSLKVELDDMYYDFIEPARRDKSLSKVISNLLRAYFEDSDVRQLVDARVEGQAIIDNLNTEIERITFEHNKSVAETAAMRYETNNLTSQFVSSGAVDLSGINSDMHSLEFDFEALLKAPEVDPENLDEYIITPETSAETELVYDDIEPIKQEVKKLARDVGGTADLNTVLAAVLSLTDKIQGIEHRLDMANIPAIDENKASPKTVEAQPDFDAQLSDGTPTNMVQDDIVYSEEPDSLFGGIEENSETADSQVIQPPMLIEAAKNVEKEEAEAVEPLGTETVESVVETVEAEMKGDMSPVLPQSFAKLAGSLLRHS